MAFRDVLKALYEGKKVQDHNDRSTGCYWVMGSQQIEKDGVISKVDAVIHCSMYGSQLRSFTEKGMSSGMAGDNNWQVMEDKDENKFKWVVVDE